MNAIQRSIVPTAWALVVATVTTPGCIRSHELSKPPLQAEREAIEAAFRGYPAVTVRQRSQTTGFTVTKEASPLLAVLTEGLQLEPKLAVVPWNEIESISTVDRGKGARMGVLAGLLLGAGLGAAVWATESDCSGHGCSFGAPGAIAFALVGAILGVGTGTAVGYRNTWTND